MFNDIKGELAMCVFGVIISIIVVIGVTINHSIDTELDKYKIQMNVNTEVNDIEEQSL